MNFDSRLNCIKTVGLLTVLGLTGCTWEQMTPQVDCDISPVQITVLNSVNNACGEANGSLAVTASGGEGPYTYSSELGSNNDGVYENIGAGNYTVVATDALGCTSELNVSIQNEEGVNLQSVAVTEAGCDTSNGTIEITATGGTEPYSYRLNGGSAQTENSFNQLGVGSYTVSVTDQTGCETSEEVEVLSGISFSNSISGIIQVNCATSGCHNGSISPNLTTLSNIQANAGRIRSRTGNRSMPPNSSLSQAHIDQIACWVNDGALDN